MLCTKMELNRVGGHFYPEALKSLAGGVTGDIDIEPTLFGHAAEGYEAGGDSRTGDKVLDHRGAALVLGAGQHLKSCLLVVFPQLARERRPAGVLTEGKDDLDKPDQLAVTVGQALQRGARRNQSLKLLHRGAPGDDKKIAQDSAGRGDFKGRVHRA